MVFSIWVDVFRVFSRSYFIDSHVYIFSLRLYEAAGWAGRHELIDYQS